MLGKGVESAGHYGGVPILHLEIANIHRVRTAFGRLHELHARPHRGGAYLRALDDSGWLRHVGSLLRGGVACAHALHAKATSLLVHCSDGWDRTAQVCALAQVLLDPHYRTLSGLPTLLDKELIAFGHPCKERLGYTPAGPLGHEWSPIIMQLLDALSQVARGRMQTPELTHVLLSHTRSGSLTRCGSTRARSQLLHQFPTAFEYNGAALRYVALAAHAGRAGQFVLSTDERREALHARRSLPSAWAPLREHAAAFTNGAHNLTSSHAFSRLLTPSPTARGTDRSSRALAEHTRGF